MGRGVRGAAGGIGDCRQGQPQADARHRPIAFRVLTHPERDQVGAAGARRGDEHSGGRATGKDAPAPGRAPHPAPLLRRSRGQAPCAGQGPVLGAAARPAAPGRPAHAAAVGTDGCPHRSRAKRPSRSTTTTPTARAPTRPTPRRTARRGMWRSSPQGSPRRWRTRPTRSAPTLNTSSLSGPTRSPSRTCACARPWGGGWAWWRTTPSWSSRSRA